MLTTHNIHPVYIGMYVCMDRERERTNYSQQQHRSVVLLLLVVFCMDGLVLVQRTRYSTGTGNDSCSRHEALMATDSETLIDGEGKGRRKVQ